MSASKRTLTLTRGVGLTRSIRWRPGGVAQDLTGYTLYMQVREREDRNALLLLQLSSDGVSPASRIEIAADQAADTGLFTLFVSTGDADAFARDSGYADIIAVDSLGQRALIGKQGWRIVVEETVTVVEEFP